MMDEDRMRLLFEGWVEAHGQYMPLYRDSEGYGSLITQTAWDAWRAGFEASTREAI